MPIYCEVSPLRPKISMHILHIVFYVISERVNKVVEWKERRKEGTYVKRAMWWRDKIISYGRLLYLCRKSNNLT